MKHIGNEIKRIMREKKIKGIDLAKKAGVTANYISEIRKKKNLNAAQLSNIAMALGVSMDVFFEDTQDTISEQESIEKVKEENASLRENVEKLTEKVDNLNKEIGRLEFLLELNGIDYHQAKQTKQII